jgi:hypothetical protein
VRAKRGHPVAPSVVAVAFDPGASVFLCGPSSSLHLADKICDQVSDAVLDACIREDPVSRVACETCTKVLFLPLPHCNPPHGAGDPLI